MSTDTTVETPTAITPTPATPEDRLIAAPAVLAEVRRVYAAMADPLDLPRTLTERQFNTYKSLWQRGEMFLIAMPSQIDLLRDALGRRRQARLERERLEAVGHRLEAEAAPKTPASEAALLAEFKALRIGVEYFENRPLLPPAVRAAFTQTCPTCGHAELTWTGPILHWQGLEQRYDRVVDDADVPLRASIAQANNWLAEVAESAPAAERTP